ncbi:hypothetical protein HY837_02260 [archaeon]|nr:hypothetical protein [archaeon]
MKRTTKLAAIIALLSAPIISDTEKLKKPEVQVVEEPVKHIRKLEADWLTKDLYGLVEAYKTNDLEAIKTFSNSLVYYNFPSYKLDEILQTLPQEQLRNGAFFLLLEYLTDNLVSIPERFSSKDEVKEREQSFKEVFSQLMIFYDLNKELINESYVTEAKQPPQKYAKFYWRLSTIIPKLPEKERSEASLKLFNILNEHFSSLNSSSYVNTINYTKAFSTILENIGDKNLINKNQLFYEKMNDFILEFFDGKEKNITSDQYELTGPLFEIVMTLEDEGRKVKAYNLFKEMILSDKYYGKDLTEYWAHMNEYLFYSFNTYCSALFEKTFTLLDHTCLDKEKEYSDLEQTASKHLRLYLDYLGEVQRTEVLFEAVNHCYLLIPLVKNPDIKEIFNHNLDKHLSNLVLNRMAKTGAGIKTEVLKDLLNRVKKAGHENVLNELIEPLKERLISENESIGFREYLFFLSTINTEESVKKYFDVLNSNQVIEGVSYPVISFLFEDEVKEDFNSFDSTLLLKQLDKEKNPAIDELVKVELTNRLKIACQNQNIIEIKTFAEASLDCNNLFFLKYMNNNWTDIENYLVEKTVNVLEQNYLPSEPALYLDGLKHIPSSKAVAEINKFYNAGSFEENNIFTQAYGNMNNILGDEGYFVLVKKMIDTLKEINTTESMKLINKISETKDEDVQIKEYAKKALN